MGNILRPKTVDCNSLFPAEYIAVSNIKECILNVSSSLQSVVSLTRIANLGASIHQSSSSILNYVREANLSLDIVSSAVVSLICGIAASLKFIISSQLSAILACGLTIHASVSVLSQGLISLSNKVVKHFSIQMASVMQQVALCGILISAKLSRAIVLTSEFFSSVINSVSTNIVSSFESVISTTRFCKLYLSSYLQSTLLLGFDKLIDGILSMYSSTYETLNNSRVRISGLSVYSSIQALHTGMVIRCVKLLSECVSYVNFLLSTIYSCHLHQPLKFTIDKFKLVKVVLTRLVSQIISEIYFSFDLWREKIIKVSRITLSLYNRSLICDRVRYSSVIRGLVKIVSKLGELYGKDP